MTDETTSEASSRSQDRRLELTLRRVAGAAERPAGCHRCAVTVGDAFNLGCPHDGHERAGESPINVRLLDVTLERVEEARKLLSDGEGLWRATPATAGAPEGPLWAQYAWRTLLIAEDEWPFAEGSPPVDRCQTALCFAGWADELDALPGERIWLVDANEAAQLDPDDFQFTLAIELSSLLLTRPDDEPEKTVHLSAYDPDAEEGDRRVVTASARAERLLGFERARDRFNVIGRAQFGHGTMAFAPSITALNRLFDSDNTLENLRRMVGELHELNDWLIAHAPANAPGDFVTGPADERPPARPREEG